MFYWKSALEFLLKQLYYPPLFSISDSQLDLQSLKYWFLNYIFLIFYWKTAYRLSGCMVLPLFSIEKLDGEFEVSIKGDGNRLESVLLCSLCSETDSYCLPNSRSLGYGNR